MRRLGGVGGLSVPSVSTDVVERAGLVPAIGVTLPESEGAADVFGVILAAAAARMTCFT